ncbi:MAG: T9SS type A sorting domain-containing protein [candidate division WOR-3 bacterium]|nr:T9SS type A sorting domain-containing protein [candidate division WOR-3 bacterium]
MNIFLTFLFLINLNIDFNRGLLTEKPVSSFPIMINPCFSSFSLSINKKLFNYQRRESLNLTLQGEYNLAGGYVNMSGWQVKPYQNHILFSSGGGFYVFSCQESLVKVAEISGPGYIFDFEIKDTLIYCASADMGLVIFNFSNISQARWIKNLYLPFEDPTSNPQYGWGATGIALKDSFAFITTRVGGLYVVNISDPLNPRIVANERSFSWLMDIIIKDTFAYVTNYDGRDTAGFIVYNIKNPLTPTIVAYAGGGVQRGMRFCIKDTLAYVGARYYGFYIINIANPRNPRLIANPRDLLEVQNVNVINFGDTVYAFVNDIRGLGIYNVSDPLNPALVTQVNVRSTATYIDLSRRRLYNQALTGAVLYDITYPYSPQLVNYYVYLGNPYYLTVHNNIAYLYDSYGCLRVLDISQSNKIREITYYDKYLESIPSGTWVADIGGMFYQNNYIYLIIRGFPWFCYLAIVDVSNPNRPEWVGTRIWRGYAGGNQFYVEDTLAFVPLALTGQTYLKILNVRNPRRIIEVGNYYWDRHPTLEISKYDSLLLMAGGWSDYPQPTYYDLGILNIRDLQNPILITEFTTPGQCRGVDKFGYVPIITVGDYMAGVHTINIVNPSSPQIIGTVDFEGYVEDVRIGREAIFCGSDNLFNVLKTDAGQNLRLYGYYDLKAKFGYGGIVTDVWSKEDEYGYCATYGGFFIFYTGLVGIEEKFSKENKLRINKSGIYSITISDISGRVILKEKRNLKNGELLSIPKLNKGVYFLKIEGKEQVNRKIVIMN